MNLRMPLIILGIFALIFLSGLAVHLATQSFQQPAESEFQKGMAFPTWIADQYGTLTSDESLSILSQATCTEWVQLVPSWYQNDRYSNRMFPDYDGQTATMESLTHAIKTSHTLGLKVMLKPHVDALSGDWRGTFQPEDPEVWFDNYTDMMMIYAKTARDEGVEILSVGCEFVDLTTPENSLNWRTLIQTIGNVYDGSLVYAANWGREALQVEFWDDLDWIGIDSYFELTNNTNPTLDELIAAWAPYLAEIESIHQAWHKPVLLTEIGYRSIDGANMRPWDWEIPGDLDLSEQALCYQAVIRAFEDKSWFRGVYWWNWEPDISLGGPTDRGYTPYGKPAELILKEWYCGEAIGKKGRSRR